MKNNLFATALLSLIIGSASAQTVSTNQVPQPVKTAFIGKYATAKKVTWEKENGAWEAAFVENGQTRSALFLTNGKQTESELEIPVAKLPETVRMQMKKDKRTIKAAAEITDAVGKMYYEAESGGKDYLFNAEGKPVSKIGQ